MIAEQNAMLTFLALIPDEKKKIIWIFIFTLFCGASKGFMKALKGGGGGGGGGGVIVNRRTNVDLTHSSCNSFHGSQSFYDTLMSIQDWTITTAQKMKFSVKGFFSKFDQIRSFLRIWSHLLKKSLMETFNSCAVYGH